MAIIGTLEVRLHSGKNMKHLDFFGKNDPYAILSCRNQRQKSKTLHGGGTHPVWNQSFFFLVNEDAAADVMIKVFDYDKHSADDLIGEARIPLGNVLTELVVPARAYYLQKSSSVPKTCGQIEVALKFSRKLQQSEKPCIASSPRDYHHHQLLHDHYDSQYHHTYEGPYGNNNEGGWK